MNSFGRIFRVSIFGESHGKTIGVLIDGCPAGLELNERDFKHNLDRRRGGTKTGTTPRKESDTPHIMSGCFNGKTTGAPILITFENRNVRSKDYSEIKDIPRPGHSDLTAHLKFGGFNDYRGGGHFSGRLTTALVAAGVVAGKIVSPMEISAKLTEAGGKKDIDEAIKEAMEEKDSVGGIIECRISNVPVGLGEPFFDSVESLISHMMFSIPAVKGIEFGAGFKSAEMKGSENNDPIVDKTGKTETNNSGGILGGITNGNELYFRIAVKPTSSIAKPQKTVNLKTGESATLEVEGRHDTCIALRIPVIVESAAAIVLADLLIMEQKIPRIFRN